MAELASPDLIPKASGRRLRISVLRDYGIVVSFVILFGVLSLSSPVFLSGRNLLNIVDQQAAIGIIACGGTLVLIAGGLDLSTAAIFALSGIIGASTVADLGVGPAMALAVLAAIGLGTINGLLATVGRINAIIATLATGIMIRGIAIATTGGQLVRVDDEAYAVLGRGSMLGIKYSVWMFLAIILVTGFLLRFTPFGRYVFAAGGNSEAARLAGVKVRLVRATTFAISGLTAGLSGILISSKVATGQPDAGQGMEISAIAAIVIGGTSIVGGEGAIWRTVLGLMLLALIRNGFNLLNIDTIFQQIFQGGIILAAVAVDAWARREVR
ncbi:MAG: ABC transporter permease [Acidimicrobiia bacterium]